MDTPRTAFDTLAEVQAWCKRAPAGTSIDAHVFADLLDTVADGEPQPEIGVSAERRSWTWRERLWTVPEETRLGVVEVAEALGRPRSFVYARTGTKAEEPIPHRKFEGTLLFLAGELREWIRESEDVVVPCRRLKRGLRAV